MKAPKREGFGEALFRDWRYDEEGKVKELLAANSADWTASIRVHINGKGVEPDRARASAPGSRPALGCPGQKRRGTSELQD